MKSYTILSLLLCVVTATVLGQCSIYGSSPKREFQYSDSLKNRNIISPNIEQIPLSKFFEPGNDQLRFTSDQYVSVIGIIKSVKYGGSELCNCHSTNQSDLDIHIELIDTLYKGVLICEINRYTRVSTPAYTLQYVKSLTGKKVELQGWLFWDGEHWMNAKNTCKNCNNVWRTTAWELHPVIRVIEK